MYAAFGRDQSYAFIDGGYLWERLAEACSKIWDRSPYELSGWPITSDLGSTKVFLCDALPDALTTPEHITRANWHKEIDSLPGGHVNYGRLKRTRKLLQQKMVDVQLSVDALTHVFRGNCRQVSVVAGDADFIPLFEALGEFGAYIQLFTFEKHANDHLCSLADEVHFFDFERIQRWLKVSEGSGVSMQGGLGGHGTLLAAEPGKWELFQDADQVFTTNVIPFSKHVRSMSFDAMWRAIKWEFDVDLESEFRAYRPTS